MNGGKVASVNEKIHIENSRRIIINMEGGDEQREKILRGVA